MDFNWKKEVQEEGQIYAGAPHPTVQGTPQARASHLYHMLEGVWALQPKCPRPVLALIYGVTLGK